MILNSYVTLCAQIATIVVMIIAILTFREDIISRNSEYMPLLIVEVPEQQQDFGLTYYKNGTMECTISTFNLKLTNIGNGNATNIQIVFDEAVINDWISVLRFFEPENEIKDNYQPFSICIPYVLTGQDNYVEIELPAIYINLFKKIYRHYVEDPDVCKSISPISFIVSYQDIQGNQVSYTSSIQNSIGVYRAHAGMKKSDGSIDSFFSFKNMIVQE